MEKDKTLTEKINHLSIRQEIADKLIIHFYDTVYNQQEDKNTLIADMCSFFFRFEIGMQEEIRKLLEEKGLEDIEKAKLLTLMEKASINMTPILKVFSK